MEVPFMTDHFLISNISHTAAHTHTHSVGGFHSGRLWIFTSDFLVVIIARAKFLSSLSHDGTSTGSSPHTRNQMWGSACSLEVKDQARLCVPA
eukprot:2088322-Rhodomonas_salina.1